MPYNPLKFQSHFPVNPGYKRQPDGLLIIPPKEKVFWGCCGSVFITAVVNIVVGFFLLLWIYGDINIPIFFIVPFLAIGIWLLITLPKSVLLALFVRDIYLSISKDRFAPGESATFFLTTKKPLHCKKLSVYLIGQEFQYTSDSSNTHDFSQNKLEELEDFTLPKNEKSRPIHITIPTNIPYSFNKYEESDGTQTDRLEWHFRIEAKFRRLPKFRAEFPIRIGPETVPESYRIRPSKVFT